MVSALPHGSRGPTLPRVASVSFLLGGVAACRSGEPSSPGGCRGTPPVFRHGSRTKCRTSPPKAPCTPPRYHFSDGNTPLTSSLDDPHHPRRGPPLPLSSSKTGKSNSARPDYSPDATASLGLDLRWLGRCLPRPLPSPLLPVEGLSSLFIRPPSLLLLHLHPRTVTLRCYAIK